MKFLRKILGTTKPLLGGPPGIPPPGGVYRLPVSSSRLAPPDRLCHPASVVAHVVSVGGEHPQVADRVVPAITVNVVHDVASTKGEVLGYHGPGDPLALSPGDIWLSRDCLEVAGAARVLSGLDLETTTAGT